MGRALFCMLMCIAFAMVSLPGCSDPSNGELRAIQGRWVIVDAQGLGFMAQVAGEQVRVSISECTSAVMDVQGSTITWRFQPPMAVDQAWVAGTSGQVAYENSRGMLIETNRVTLNANTDPKVIDLVVLDDGSTTSFRFKGIYELTGNTLRIRLSGYLDKRPETFTDSGGRDMRMLTLKRG